MRKTSASLDALLLFACLAPRLYYFAPGIDSWDAVDFALSLRSFELASYQPHFPGYPVFWFLAKCFSVLGVSDAAALALPGVLALCFASVALRRTVASFSSSWVGLGAALLFLVSPGVMVAGFRPLSDALGLSFLVLAACAGAKGRFGLSGVLLGLTLGVRLSYFPFFFSWLFFAVWRPKGERASVLKQVAVGFCLGTLLWLVPLFVSEGLVLWEEGLRFTGGHLTRWGGAVGGDTELGARGVALLWGFFAYNLGGLWPEDGVSVWRLLASLAALSCLVGLGLTLRAQKARRAFLLLWLPYFFWVTLGQNPESPRHWLPLVSLFLIFGAVSLRGYAFVAAFGLSVVSLPLAKEQAETKAPQQRAAEYIAQNFPEGVRFYGWKTTRLVEYYSPQSEAKLSRSMADMQKHIASVPTQKKILFESKLEQRRRRDRCFEVVQSFRRSRYLDPAYASLTLFVDCEP